MPQSDRREMPTTGLFSAPCIETVRHKLKMMSMELCRVPSSSTVAVTVANANAPTRSIYAKTPRTVQPRRVNGRSASRPPRQYPLSARFQSQPQPFALATDPILQLGLSTWSCHTFFFFYPIMFNADDMF
jgi:hypothetical protein